MKKEMYFPSLLWIFPSLPKWWGDADINRRQSQCWVSLGDSRATGPKGWGMAHQAWREGGRVRVRKPGSWRNRKGKMREKAVGCEGRGGWSTGIEGSGAKWGQVPKRLLDRHRENRKTHAQPAPGAWIWTQASFTRVPAFPECCQALTSTRYWTLTPICLMRFLELPLKGCPWYKQGKNHQPLTVHYISTTLHPGLRVQIVLLRVSCSTPTSHRLLSQHPMETSPHGSKMHFRRKRLGSRVSLRKLSPKGLEVIYIC